MAKSVEHGWKRLVLVLSGGNAVGAFQGGFLEGLQERGLLPDLVVGASVGALNGTIFAANRPQDSIPRLRTLWDRLAMPGGPSRPGSLAAVAAARTMGRPPLFAPVLPSMVHGTPGQPGLYTLEPVKETLAELADLRTKLSCPLIIVATDLAEGVPAVFDSRKGTLRPEHVQSSCALIGDFVPVEMDGRLYCDGGLSANLPLGLALLPPAEGDTLCVAVDLFDRAGPPPATLEEALGRRLDLAFAAQSRLEIERLRAAFGGKRKHRVLVAHVRRDTDRELVGQKVFDFSAGMIERRWDDGRSAVEKLIARLPSPEDCASFDVVELRG